MAILDWTLSFSDWVLVMLGVGVGLYFWGMSPYRRFMKPTIPHRKPLPFIGNMGSSILRNKPFNDTILDAYKAVKGKPYGAMFMMRQPTILLSDLELIKTIAIKDFEYFTDHRTTVFENGDPVWQRNLFSLKGQEWRDMRSILSPAFTSSKMKTMFLLMSECCQQFVNYFDQCYTKPPENGYQIKKDDDLLILEFKDFYTRFANDVIATTAFGVGVDSLKQPKNKFFMMGQKATSFNVLRILVFFALPQLMKILGISLIPGNIANFFRSIVMDTIATRKREGIVRPDLLQLLMQAQKGAIEDEDSGAEIPSTKNKKKLDDQDVVSQVLIFFLAGFDTTSSVLCFATHHLAVHPDVQTRLQKELDEAFQNDGGKFTYEAIHSMKYLDMVVSETLRFYPPAGAIDRVCIRNYTLKADPPLELVPGDNIFIPIVGIHRDPENYDDPDRFDPERFSDENKHKIKPMAYIPFGVGPRICIGNRFSLMEVKLALAHLLLRYNLKVISKTSNPIQIVQKGFNLTAKGGFWLGVQRRNC